MSVWLIHVQEMNLDSSCMMLNIGETDYLGEIPESYQSLDSVQLTLIIWTNTLSAYQDYGENTWFEEWHQFTLSA